MRKKSVIRNIFTNIILQVVLALTGLIIPRYILICFGSAVNGMVATISQFITCASLVELGIVNAASLMLYKPLLSDDYDTISTILSTVKKTYRKSGILYVFIILFLALTYSYIIRNQINQNFVFSVFITIAMVNAVDYFFLAKYKVLLIADQNYYILNVVKVIATLIQLFFSLMLLLNDKSLLLVKGVAIITRGLEGILLKKFVKKKYKSINYNSEKICTIYQRGSTFVHQFCATVVYNSDLVILTVFLSDSSLLEISVYTVYAMVLSLVNNLVSTFTTGINATFGNMYANNEREHIKKAFDIYEYIYFVILFIVYTCFGLLIVNFVSCYTSGIYDTDYVRVLLGILFMFIGISAQIKDISGVILTAAGHYKQTQIYVIGEAVINIILSIILIEKYGLVGVLIGTFVSHLYMSYGIIRYVGKELLCGTIKRTICRIFRNVVLSVIILFGGLYFFDITIVWIIWVKQAVFCLLVSTILFIIFNFLFEPKVFKEVRSILKQIRC